MKTIVLGLSGSIACYKGAEVASLLTQKGYKVYTVMTDAAGEFISPLTLRSLTGNAVFRDMFENRATHVSLAKEADLILIAPATACFISKLAGGIVSDLLTLTVISSNAAVLICPAMNEQMYKNKIIQDNIEKLKKYGYHFLGPYEGWLSCGYQGKGRLADVIDIVAEAEKFLQ